VSLIVDVEIADDAQMPAWCAPSVQQRYELSSIRRANRDGASRKCCSRCQKLAPVTHV
jgi:hypothetical protein